MKYLIMFTALTYGPNFSSHQLDLSSAYQEALLKALGKRDLPYADNEMEDLPISLLEDNQEAILEACEFWGTL